jgi:hypothetical protein
LDLERLLSVGRRESEEDSAGGKQAGDNATMVHGLLPTEKATLSGSIPIREDEAAQEEQFADPVVVAVDNDWPHHSLQREA